MSRRQAAPIAYRLLSEFRRLQVAKLLAFEDLAAAREITRELEREIGPPADLSRLHPSHALYVCAQNDLALIASQLALLPELRPLARLVSKEEERLMPSGPPMSPLTTSFFTCWSLFDAGIGAGRETFTTVAIALAESGVTKVPPEWCTLWQRLQQSHMGIYRHEGVDGAHVRLRDIVTGESCAAYIPSGCLGRAGELWYVRLLPPPAPTLPPVAFTTPYILLQPGCEEWRAYFSRAVPGLEAGGDWSGYHRHMKFGPSRSYWNDFVFEAYVNFTGSCVYLEGLPDIAASRPHAREREAASLAAWLGGVQEDH